MMKKRFSYITKRKCIMMGLRVWEKRVSSKSSIGVSSFPPSKSNKAFHVTITNFSSAMPISLSYKWPV